MPTLTVKKDIVFQYTDTGPADHNEYTTLIFIHGFAFHSGTFQKISPVANSHKLRVICLNRRGYPGTFPYTDEEIRVVNHGSEDERASFFHEEGILMALFVDSIIQTLSLPEAGGVTIIGWSMGNKFILALRACIGDLPVDTQQRLKSYVRSFILWDPSSSCFGFRSPDPPPDFTLRGVAEIFLKRVSSHYKHVNLDSKDPSHLDQIGDPSRKPTTETMTPEELLSALDFTCIECDIPLFRSFSSVFSTQMRKALVDSQVRKDWGNASVWHIYGDSNPPPLQEAPWFLEEELGPENVKLINFKRIKDANHFLMWEEPDRFLTVMKEGIPL